MYGGTNHSSFSRTWTALLVLLAVSAWSASAQDVELNPGTISGTVKVGNEPISSLGLFASSGPFSASQGVSPGGATSASYSLTVQVEQGGSRTYDVDASIRTNSQDFMNANNRTVVVTDGQPATLDFVFDPASFVTGNVTITGGGQLSSLFVQVFESTAPFDSAFTSFGVSGGPTSAAYEFPATPGTYTCRGTARP